MTSDTFYASLMTSYTFLGVQISSPNSIRAPPLHLVGPSTNPPCIHGSSVEP